MVCYKLLILITCFYQICISKALKPQITTNQTEVETVYGKDVILNCTVFETPRPEVKWFHNGTLLEGERYTFESGNLHISNVNFQDSGEYICSVEHKSGAKNETYKLTVRKYTTVRITELYEVVVKEPVTLQCNPEVDENFEVEVTWLRDGKKIDYDSEPRFAQSTDFSLTVTSTTELDSDTYTCVAKTRLDQVDASVYLIVQDVPNPPQLEDIRCNKRDVEISWRPLGDNRSPILRYSIEYSTSFTPNEWKVAYDEISPVEWRWTVPVSPWANYTFRVIAWNSIGRSEPSPSSSICSTEPDVPYKNPDNVKGKGDQPNNLIISWNPMPEIEHNGPGFHYKVYWKQNVDGAEYEARVIHNWQEGSIVIENRPTFTQYRIKVIAENDLGPANVAAEEIIGHSGNSDA